MTAIHSRRFIRPKLKHRWPAAAWFITTPLPGRHLAAPKPDAHRKKSAPERRNATDAEGKRALISAEDAVAWRISVLALDLHFRAKTDPPPEDAARSDRLRADLLPDYGCVTRNG